MDSDRGTEVFNRFIRAFGTEAAAKVTTVFAKCGCVSTANAKGQSVDELCPEHLEAVMSEQATTLALRKVNNL